MRIAIIAALIMGVSSFAQAGDAEKVMEVFEAHTLQKLSRKQLAECERKVKQLTFKNVPGRKRPDPRKADCPSTVLSVFTEKQAKEASERLRGDNDTTVLLSKEGDFWRLAVSRFSMKTGEEIRSAVLAIFAEEKYPNIFLDLYDNKGGSCPLNELIGFVSQPEQILVTQTWAAKTVVMTAESIYADALAEDSDATRIGEYRNANVVVGINANTKSCGEIFAGTLQLEGYPVIGETSFGKEYGSIAIRVPGTKYLIAAPVLRTTLGDERVTFGEGIVPNRAATASTVLSLASALLAENARTILAAAAR